MDKQYNYYALLVAIFKKHISVDGAINVFSRLDKTKNTVDKAEVSEMIRLRSTGLTYSQIGQMYGIDRMVAYRRIIRHGGAM